MFEAQQEAKRRASRWIYGVLTLVLLCWIFFLAYAALVPSSELAHHCEWLFRGSLSLSLLGLLLSPAALVAVVYTESLRSRRLKAAYSRLEPSPLQGAPQGSAPALKVQPAREEVRCSCPELMLRYSLCRMSLWLSLCCLVLAATCLVSLALLFSQARELPVRQGRLQAPFLARDVVVERDSLGVVHLTGRSASDVLRAQGFVMAQERMFQLDVVRRLASGTLAELLGPEAVEADVFMRTLGLEATPAALPGSEEDFRIGLNAFVARVNNATSWPSHEYRTLGVLRVDPFSRDDMRRMARMAALLVTDDSHSLAREMRRYFLVANKNHSVAEASRLVPRTAAANPAIGTHLCVPAPPAATAELGAALPALRSSRASYGFRNDLTRRLLEPYFRLNETSGHARGSAWVVSGSNSESHAPLLAVDFHSLLLAPSAWMMFELEWPGVEFHGLTVVGAPLIFSGTLAQGNYSLAWGVTSSMVDSCDATVLQMDGDRYWLNGVSTPMQTEQHVVRVRGAPEVNVTVRRTHFGPVLSDAVALPGSAPVAVSWAMGGAVLAPLRMLEGVHSEEEWRERLPFPQASLSHVFADSEDHVALVVGGVRVERDHGDGSWPLLSNHTRGWLAQRPLHLRVPEPRSGFLVAANNRICVDGQHYGSDWDEGWRAARLHDRIANLTHMTVEQQLELQTDRVSVEWLARWRPLLALFRPAGELAARWHSRLAAFEGNMQLLSADAMMAQWWVHSQLLAASHDRQYVADALQSNDTALCGANGCSAWLSRSLERAVSHLPLGANYLGHLAQAETYEPYFSYRGQLEDCFWSSVARSSGGPSTLNTAYYSPSLHQRAGVAARLAVELGHDGRMVSYQGPSGHVFDRLARRNERNLYNAPFELWQSDGYILLSRDSFLFGSVWNLTLVSSEGSEP